MIPTTTCIMNLYLKRTGLLLIIGALFFSSCKDANEILLDPDSTPDKIGTHFTDTFSITSSQIILDFFSTSSEQSGNDFLLFGQYQDEHLGQIKAHSFSEVLTSQSKIPVGAQLKEFKIHLKLDYNIGPKDGPQKINIYKLKDSLNFFSLRDREYSFSSIGPEAGELINTENEIILPSDNNLDITLNEALGREFIDFFDTTKNQLEFRRFFKGILIKGDEGNSTVFGINRDSSRFVLTYTTATDTTDITFPISNYHFNHIDRTSTPTIAPETTIIQSSTGYMTKISFSGVRKLVEGRKVAVNKAVLEIVPEVEDNISPPSNLFLIQSGWNKMDSLVIDPVSTRQIKFDTAKPAIKNLRVVQFGTTGNPQLFNENAYNIQYNNAEGKKKYEADITSYIEAILNDEENKYPTELILYPEAPGNMVTPYFSYSISQLDGVSRGTINKDLSLNKAVIQNQKIKLKIYYTLLD